MLRYVNMGGAGIHLAIFVSTGREFSLEYFLTLNHIMYETEERYLLRDGLFVDVPVLFERCIC